MRIPLNVIHWYIGWPVVLIIALRSLILRNSSKNMINTYFGLAAWTFLLCLTAYGLPLQFTDDSKILTVFTIIADSLQFLALFFLWLAALRLYLPSNTLVRRTIGGADLVVVAIGIAVSITSNMATPVTLTYVNSAWQLNFSFPFAYQIITAIQYSCLLLIASKFWTQSRSVAVASQKLRLRAFSAGFLIYGGVFVVRPFLTVSPNSVPQAILLAVGLLITGAFTVATIYLGHKEASRAAR